MSSDEEPQLDDDDDGGDNDYSNDDPPSPSSSLSLDDGDEDDGDEDNENEQDIAAGEHHILDDEATDRQPPNNIPDVQQQTLGRRCRPIFNYKIIVICGRMRMSREVITAHVKSLGCNIWTSQLPDERIPIKGLVVSSQIECNREPRCIVQNLAEGFRRGWAIVSESYIEKCAERGFDVGVEEYFKQVKRCSPKSTPETKSSSSTW